MSITTGLAIYTLIWWLTFFAVLPFGVRSQEESGDVISGTDPGAPAIHRVWRKVLYTTLVSAVVFGALAFVYLKGLIPFEWLDRISEPPVH